MKIDCSRYRANIPTIAANTKDLIEDWEKLYEYIRVFSAASHTPIIAVACYVGELYGVPEHLCQYIQSLCAFYKVTEVLNTTCNFSSV